MFRRPNAPAVGVQEVEVHGDDRERVPRVVPSVDFLLRS
jgi:hypothetical protein